MIPTRPARILVPTDFSETGTNALRYAAGLARHLGADLTVMYADTFLPPVDAMASVGGWDETSVEQLKARATEQLLSEAQSSIDSVLYDAVVRLSTPVGGIIEQARESRAGLIVMGTHGRSGLRRLLTGSVTEAVMHASPVPVIAVPPHGQWTGDIRTVVCPANYSELCFDALSLAAALASPSARFIVLRATPLPDLSAAADEVMELRRWIPDWVASRCDIKIMDGGNLAEKAEAFAASIGADLIVAAEPADRNALDILYGTFASRVVQHSACAVLTMNAPSAAVFARASWRERGTSMAWATQ